MLFLPAQIDEDEDAEEEPPGESTMDGDAPGASPAAGPPQQQQQQPGGTPAAVKAKGQTASAVFNEVVIDEVRAQDGCRSRAHRHAVVKPDALQPACRLLTIMLATFHSSL